VLKVCWIANFDSFGCFHLKLKLYLPNANFRNSFQFHLWFHLSIINIWISINNLNQKNQTEWRVDTVLTRTVQKLYERWIFSLSIFICPWWTASLEVSFFLSIADGHSMGLCTLCRHMANTTICRHYLWVAGSLLLVRKIFGYP